MPGYVERSLGPGETISYRARLHGILYLGAAWPAVAAVAAVVVSAFAPPGVLHTALLIAAMIALLACLARLLATWLRIVNTEIVVTSRRVIFKTGLLRRRSIEMNLDKVESVVVDQGLVARMFDFGSVLVRGVGAGLEPIERVAAPLELRRRITGS